MDLTLRDTGAILAQFRAFYDTNLELTLADAPFNFYDRNSPIYTHARYLPGSVIEKSVFKDVLLAEGCRISQAEILHSVIGLRSRIASGVRLKDSIVMGADSYVVDDSSGIPVGIGKNCDIRGRDLR